MVLKGVYLPYIREMYIFFINIVNYGDNQNVLSKAINVSRGLRQRYEWRQKCNIMDIEINDFLNFADD